VVKKFLNKVPDFSNSVFCTRKLNMLFSATHPRTRFRCGPHDQENPIKPKCACLLLGKFYGSWEIWGEQGAGKDTTPIYLSPKASSKSKGSVLEPSFRGCSLVKKILAPNPKFSCRYDRWLLEGCCPGTPLWPRFRA